MTKDEKRELSAPLRVKAIKSMGVGYFNDALEKAVTIGWNAGREYQKVRMEHEKEIHNSRLSPHKTGRPKLNSLPRLKAGVSLEAT